MQSVGSLIQQQPQPSGPPQTGQSGDAGGPGASSLTSLLQGAGGGQSGLGGAPGQPQAPSHAEVTMGLTHFGELARRWKAMLADPGIGTKNMRPAIMDMAADLIGDDFLTLPQAMNELKTLPTDPLQQRKWIETHYKNARQAMTQLLTLHANSAPPPADAQTELGRLPPPTKDHTGTMTAMVERFKQKGAKRA